MTTDKTNLPVHEPFEWYTGALRATDAVVPGRVFANAVDKTRDISAGVSAVLGLLEADEIAAASGERRMLGPEAGDMLRMAIRALDMLRDDAEGYQNWGAEHHTRVAQLRGAVAPAEATR